MSRHKNASDSPRKKMHPVSFTAQVVKLFFQKNVMRSAAQTSYYLLLSLFPLLMVTIGIVSMLNLNLASVIAKLNTLTSLFGDNSMITDYLIYVISNDSPGLMWTGVITLVTASSAAFRALMLITGEICGRPSFKSYFQLPVSIIMSFVLVLAIFTFMLATLTGHWFLDFCVTRLHLPNISYAWMWIRYPVLAAIGFLCLTAIYRVCLSKKVLPNGKAWPGALFSTIVLIAATALFSMFFNWTTRYSLIYGSLATIIILLLWFFLCSNIVIVGILVDYVIAIRAAGQDEPTVVFSLRKVSTDGGKRLKASDSEAPASQTAD